MTWWIITAFIVGGTAGMVVMGGLNRSARETERARQHLHRMIGGPDEDDPPPDPIPLHPEPQEPPPLDPAATR